MVDVKHKAMRSESRLTPEVRFAFPFLHEKRTKRADGTPLKSPRHDIVILLPKLHNDPAQCPNYKFLAGLAMEAATKAWGSWPAGGKWPINDGDVPYTQKPKPGVVPKTPEQLAAGNAWRKGNWVIEATNYLDPGPRIAILGTDRQAVEIPAKVVAGVQLYKSGDYGFASIAAYSYQNETFGVNFSLEGVLFTKPGDPIGSGGQKSAEEMFGSVAAVAGATPMGPPAAFAHPAPPAAAPVAMGYVPPAPTTGAVATAPTFAPSPGFPPQAPGVPPAGPPMPPAAPVPPAPPTAAYAPPATNGAAPALPPFPAAS